MTPSKDRGMVQRRLNLSEQFREAFGYIRDCRREISFVVLLFILGWIFGSFFASYLGFLNEFLERIVAQTQGMNGYQLGLFILQNNLNSSFWTVLLGSALGIIPILSTFFNGVVVGYVVESVSAIEGMGFFSLVFMLLPHGVFELPAVFISFGMGLRLGLSLFSKNPLDDFGYRLGQSANVLLFVVLPLLIIAAIIETLLIFLFP